MYRVTGTIKGIADILFNSRGPVEEEGDGTKHASKMSLEELRERALERLHRNENGIFLPADALLGSLFLGANRAGLKDGKRALAGTLEALVFVEGDLLFGRDAPDYIHEVWGRVPPRTGSQVVLRRPALNAGWQVPFTFMVADDRISAKDLRTAMDHAGLLVGVGGWRPRYGRFQVVEWKVERDKVGAS